MKSLLAALALLLMATPALAQKSCDELKAEIEAKIKANGVKEFTLERVGKSGAVFNIEKLDWLNFQHLRKKPDGEVLGMLREYLSSSSYAGSQFSDQYLVSVITAMRERASFVKDFVEKCPYFYRSPDQYDPDVVKKRWKPESAAQLRALADKFAGLSSPAKEEYEDSLHEVAEALRVKQSDLIHPLRLAVSGMGAGPGLYDILIILGKEEVIRRVNTAIQELK